ncbi:MAG: MBL fold metallo-hydrolase [Verrucomicrobiota bacterium]
MRGNTLTCFGVGDGLPCGDRNHSAFLYQLGKSGLLIDCGEPLSCSFKASGLDYNLLDRIFLSHLHCDHIGGFFMFTQGLWLEQRTKPLTVNLPEYGIKPIRQLLDSSMIFDELLSFRLRFEGLKAGKPVTFNGTKVTPFHTTHLESLRRAFQRKYPHPFEAFSFLIETRGVRIAHSADLGAPEDLEPLLRKPVDLLVCELAHFATVDLFRYLHGRPIKQLVLIHLSRPHWEDRAKVRELGKKLLGGIPFSIARDGETFKF